MATTQLTLFNDALSLLGLRSLSATTDATEPGRVLVGLWDQTRQYCLEQARWRFAERQATLSVAAGQVAAEPAYGLLYAYAKPSDFVTLNSIAADDAFTTPVDNLHERGGYWYTDTPDNIYIQYVSDDATFGQDVTLWPENFVQFYIHYLALRAAPRLAPSLLGNVAVANSAGNPRQGTQQPRNILALGMSSALELAKNYDTVEGPSVFLPGGVTSQLSVFNNAMWMLGGRNLVTVTDAGDAPRTLLQLWDRAVEYCLQQGHWIFAEEQVKLDTPSVTEVPTEGLRYAYELPEDFIRTNEIAGDEYFSSPVFDIHQRNNHLYVDLNPLYLRYTSRSVTRGFNYAEWPESFTIYVTLYLATLAAPFLAPDRKAELITAPGNVGLAQAKLNALGKDAVEGPTEFLPQGRWSGSRNSYRNTGRGRNSRHNLYGN